jgi:hypothetical protein
MIDGERARLEARSFARLFLLMCRLYAFASTMKRRLPGAALEKCDVGTAQKATVQLTKNIRQNKSTYFQYSAFCELAPTSVAIDAPDPPAGREAVH